MPSIVELKYNPYIPDLSVLINGNKSSSFSSLVQYSDEDIMLWYDKILDTIYAEIRNEFIVVFVGTQADAEIMERTCREHRACVGFRKKDFSVAEPLQNRMKKLNQYIKNNGKTRYAKTIIDIVFIIPKQMKKYQDNILELDVKNLFCSVRVSTIGFFSEYCEKDDSFLFLITNSDRVGLEELKRFKTSKIKFVLVVGEEQGLISVENGCWIYGTTDDMMFNAIFMCLLQSPLMFAFRKCVNSFIKEDNDDEFKKIYTVEPIIKVDVEDKIEVGRSAKLNVLFDPPTKNAHELIYKMTNEKVAVFDGLCVSAKQEGTTSLEVYINGESKPAFTKKIHTYKRNRINKIILDDDSLLLGLGDYKRLSLEYFPVDADNANTIAWKSSDENIIKVDKNGMIEAVGIGSCRVICTAENVSAQCKCQVKARLKSISTDLEIEDNVLRVEPMTEINFNIKTFPDDCIDDSLTIETSNYAVANVVNTTLYAKERGEATITIKNVNGRISEMFLVVVKKNKHSFFKSLFNKK